MRLLHVYVHMYAYDVCYIIRFLLYHCSSVTNTIKYQSLLCPTQRGLELECFIAVDKTLGLWRQHMAIDDRRNFNLGA